MHTRPLAPLLIGTLLLTACGAAQPSGTPMDHSQMGHGTMGQDANATATASFLPGMGKDVSTLPEAKPAQVVDVGSGQTIDLNPTLVRKTLNGRTFAMYGYNGQFPGPLLRVKQGSTFTVNTRNDTDQPTSIHWHGVRLENGNDGTVGLTQKEIAPGGSFRYAVRVPDEGLFWYHPHVREDIQQDMGLYGGLQVTPADGQAYGPVNAEEVLLLDDMALDIDGLPTPYGGGNADHALMGRFGNTMLVNGQTAYSLKARQGEVIRFSVLNAANTRTFRVTFGGARMKLVGGDAGRSEKEAFVEAVTLSPSERAIVEVLFDRAGTYALRHESPERSYDLGTVNVSDEPASPSYAVAFGTLRAPKDVAAGLAVLRPFFGKPVDKVVHLSVESEMMASQGGMQHGGMEHGGMTMGGGDGIEWEDPMPQMNRSSGKENTTWKLVDEASAKENMDIDYRFKVGDKVKIRLVNDTEDEGSDHPMQHPIHFHGQRFLILEEDGKRNDNLVWKDTVLVPSGKTVDILLDVTNPGDWMFHCHIAEHLSNGMMGEFRVES